jgi:leader peptidase (prepilin peptidase)/N-methyltransferase
MGDVKMMAGLSAVAGPLGIPWLTLLAASSALITAAVQRTPIHSQNEIPLGCFLAISGALIWALQAIGLF